MSTYNTFIHEISRNPSHHGKFLVHIHNENEYYKLYRFADFIQHIKQDLKTYEHFELKNNVLYKFKTFIHAPNEEQRIKNLRQHSTTMTLMYKILGGENIEVNKNEKIKVIVYDHTNFKTDLKITTSYTTVKNKKDLFKFKENEVIKVLENTGSIKTLTIIKSFNIPYFNFSSNNIVPTDIWSIENLTPMFHSIVYIVDNNLFYKFPDEEKLQSIDFNVYLTDNAVYHKCIIQPETSKHIKHYEGSCCYGSNYLTNISETKPILEEIKNIRTIKHYYLYDFANPNLKELQKICNIQKQDKINFMNRNLCLIKYINSL